MPAEDVSDPLVESYWSPAQVRLFVDGVWIDDACAVMYRIFDNKVPKYGYWDRFLRTVAQGTTLVQGRLSINFRYNGYLRTVIEDQVRRRKDALELEDGLHIDDYQALRLSTTDRLEWLNDQAIHAPPEVRKKRFDFFKRKLWSQSDILNSNNDEADKMTTDIPFDSPEGKEEAKERRAFLRPGLFTDGFDITMEFGAVLDEYNDPGLIRVIQAVHLTGESVVAEIDVPDGGRAIREVYDFLARDVRSGEPNGRVPSDGGAAGVNL
jgi:hypothetical protein